jgi:hypothetical protein
MSYALSGSNRNGRRRRRRRIRRKRRRRRRIKLGKMQSTLMQKHVIIKVQCPL